VEAQAFLIAIFVFSKLHENILFLSQ